MVTSDMPSFPHAPSQPTLPACNRKHEMMKVSFSTEATPSTEHIPFIYKKFLVTTMHPACLVDFFKKCIGMAKQKSLGWLVVFMRQWCIDHTPTSRAMSRPTRIQLIYHLSQVWGVKFMDGHTSTIEHVKVLNSTSFKPAHILCAC